MADIFKQKLVELLPRLRRFARGLTGDREAADDLLQAACEKALARRAQWRPGTRLDSWMYRIIQNQWIDGLRAAEHRYRGEADTEQAAGPDWQRHVESQRALDEALAAMAQLAPDMRAVLALVCVQELSYKEAAEILEIPIGTVMSRLARARLALHRSLAGGDGA